MVRKKKTKQNKTKQNKKKQNKIWIWLDFLVFSDKDDKP